MDNMKWNNDTEEQQEPLTPIQVHAALCELLGEDLVPPLTPEEQAEQTEQIDFEPTQPEINFPELENPPKTLAFQQNKAAQNPPIPAQNPRQPGFYPSETGLSDSKPARSPFEPQRGPRGLLNELPEPTQQKILELLETESAEAVIELLEKPAPEGIGRRISRRALLRFQNRHAIIEQRAEADATAETARQLASDPGATDADLTNATLRIIRAAVLEYAADIQNFEALERLNTVLHKLRRADQADRRQAYLEHAKSNETKTL